MDKKQILAVLHARDTALEDGENKEEWDNLVYDFFGQNLLNFFKNPEEYSENRGMMIFYKNKQTGKVEKKKTSRYCTCAICCDDDCELNKAGLCPDCVWKTKYFSMLHKYNIHPSDFQ